MSDGSCGLCALENENVTVVLECESEVQGQAHARCLCPQAGSIGKLFSLFSDIWRSLSGEYVQAVSQECKSTI